VSTEDSDGTNRELGRHRPKKHCLSNIRNGLPVEEVRELYRVSPSSHGKVVGFRRSRSGGLEVDQAEVRNCGFPRPAGLEEVQTVPHTVLVIYVKEEDLQEGRTHLLHEISFFPSFG
jgi:hypothetical protein